MRLPGTWREGPRPSSWLVLLAFILFGAGVVVWLAAVGDRLGLALAATDLGLFLALCGLGAAAARHRAELRSLGARAAAERDELAEMLRRGADRRHALETDLQRQHAFTEAVLSNVEVGVLACDADGAITLWNQAAAVLVTGDPETSALTPDMWDDVLWPTRPDGTPYRPEELPLERAVAGDEARGEELELLRPDGQVRVHLVSAQTMRDADGRVIGAVSAIQDITDRKRDEMALTSLAMQDHLTGLPNRLMLNQRLGTALRRVAATSRLALLFIDLDRFKVVNDSRGHHVGDRLLRLVADRINGQLRPGDMAARMGGDEFVILCEGVSGEIEALGIADRIRTAIERPIRIDEDQMVVTCSVGVVIADDCESPDDLLRRADLAMYRAKDDGRATVRVYEPTLGAEVARRFRLENALREALADDQMAVVYQQVVDASDLRPVAVEALVRWRRGERLVGPAAFIDVAEDSGLIAVIDQLVLRQACADAAAAGSPLQVGVNLSSRRLSDPDLASTVRAVLDETGLPGERLCLELTEHALIDAGPSLDANLHDLRADGVSLALDDFGTGYASLNYLRRFPVDIVKIDTSFITRIVDSPVDRSIVSATIQMAGQLGLHTIAEGIETREQADLLRGLGCDQLQGFLFSRPTAADRVPGLQPLAARPRGRAR